MNLPSARSPSLTPAQQVATMNDYAEQISMSRAELQLLSDYMRSHNIDIDEYQCGRSTITALWFVERIKQ